jgi:PTH2 family peptidyl-tRNA hydrolase
MDNELDINLQSALDGFVKDCRTEVPDRDSELKIWIMARKDLDISLGKFGPQAAHAAGTCMVLSDRKNYAPDGERSLIDTYLSQGQPKITVAVEDEAELRKCIDLCRAEMLITAIVEDAGRTEFDGKTITVGAVGPCLRSDLPSSVRRLRAFKKD